MLFMSLPGFRSATIAQYLSESDNKRSFAGSHQFREKKLSNRQI